jgi:glycosyltransferase involved in cell wall biosynthesis
VASSIGALPEVVSDSVTGLLFPPGDAGALAAAVRKLEDDRECTRLGEGAWKEWNARYSPEVGLKELEEAYRRALAEPASRQQPP